VAEAEAGQDRTVALFRAAVPQGLEAALLPLVRPEAPRFAHPRYTLEEMLGEGGMAVVYRAFDRQLRRFVAVKIMKEGSEGEEIRRRRLMREAQAVARISHPNVVAIHDVGEEGERLYLVMELVEGRALNHILAARREGLPSLLRLLEQAAGGVAAVHALGMVHRDLKPSNVFVTSEGNAKVGDFGLARAWDGTQTASWARPDTWRRSRCPPRRRRSDRGPTCMAWGRSSMRSSPGGRRTWDRPRWRSCTNC
jgi:serine/threonine protein kinase